MGPFTLRESLTLGISAVPLAAWRISPEASASAAVAALCMAFWLIFQGRRGRRPLHLAHSYILYRMGIHRSPLLPQQKDDSGMRQYAISGLSFSFAPDDEREAVLSSFLGLCAGEGEPVHFLSVPGMSDSCGRSFYMALPRGITAEPAVGSANVRPREGGSLEMHPLLGMLLSEVNP